MSHHDLLRNIAALTVLSAEIRAQLDAAKAELGSDVVRGTLVALADPADPTSPPLGSFTMSKPRQGAPRIVDETLALSWAIEEFGVEGIVEQRLSEQGRKSVLEAAKRGPVPGVQTPAPGAPVATFRQDADEKAAVLDLWRRGELKFEATLPTLGGAQ